MTYPIGGVDAYCTLHGYWWASGACPGCTTAAAIPAAPIPAVTNFIMVPDERLKTLPDQVDELRRAVDELRDEILKALPFNRALRFLQRLLQR